MGVFWDKGESVGVERWSDFRDIVGLDFVEFDDWWDGRWVWKREC